MKIIISDTGPILSLALIHRLDILDTMYPEFLVPYAVYMELRDYLPRFTRKHEEYLENLEKHIAHIKDFENVRNYGLDFGPGEAECLALAKETGIRYFLVDDAAARKIAEEEGIQCFGTLALMMEAKELGLIENLRPYFLDFLNAQRFYQGALLEMILKKFGEDPL